MSIVDYHLLTKVIDYGKSTALQRAYHVISGQRARRFQPAREPAAEVSFDHKIIYFIIPYAGKIYVTIPSKVL